MRTYCELLIFVTAFVHNVKVTENISNLFCAPQCRLPGVGETFCRQISVLLQCRYRSKSKTSAHGRKESFQCGCKWLSTLADLRNNSHVAESKYYTNCQKISELYCDKFKQQRQSYREKAIKVSRRLFNFTNDRWIDQLTYILRTKQHDFSLIHGRHQRWKAKHKLASFLKDAILSVKDQAGTDNKVTTITKRGNIKVLYHVYRNSTGHYIHFGSEVFNLVKHEWLDRFTKYVWKLRKKIDDHNDIKVRRKERLALKRNIHIFLLAVQRESELDQPNETGESVPKIKLTSPVETYHRTTAKQQPTTTVSKTTTTTTTAEPKTTKKSVRTTKKLLETTTKSGGTIKFNTAKTVKIGTTTPRPSLKSSSTVSSKVASSKIQPIDSHVKNMSRNTSKSKTKSRTKHRQSKSRHKTAMSGKKMNYWRSRDKHSKTTTAINRPSPKADETRPIGYNDADLLSDKWLKLYTQLTYESDGWKNVKDTAPNNKITTDDIFGTLRKRQKPIYFFIGIVGGIVVLIVCLLWTKKKVDDRKLRNSANIQQLGDLDLIIQQKKRNSCWENCCRCFKRESAEYIPKSQPVVLYPDIKTMKKTAYGGQSKPKMANRKYQTSQRASEDELQLTHTQGSEEDVAGESYRIFHYRMMEGFNSDVDGRDPGFVKSSKSE